jgi:hypothetical protein
MRSGGLSLVGSILTVAMLVLAISILQHADLLAKSWARPDVATWAIRSGAVAIAAAAEFLLLVMVIGTLWRPTVMGDWLGRTALLAFILSIGSAITLALIGR